MGFKDRGTSDGGWGYRAPKKEQVRERANQRGGEFDSPIKQGVPRFSAKPRNRVRVCPATWEDAEHYGFDVWVHYSVGADNGTYVCPAKMQDKPCPPCEEANDAAKHGDAETAKKLKPKRRVGIMLIDRDDEESGPKLWLAPWGFDKELSALQENPKTGAIVNVDDPENGFDVNFRREGEGLTTKYIALQIERESSPISDDPKVEAAWRKSLKAHPIPSCLDIFDEEYLRKVLTGAKPEDEEKDDGDEDEPETRASTKKKGAPVEVEPEAEEEPDGESEDAPEDEDAEPDAEEDADSEDEDAPEEDEDADDEDPEPDEIDVRRPPKKEKPSATREKIREGLKGKGKK